MHSLLSLSDQVLTRIPEVFQLQLPVEVTPLDDLPCAYTREQVPLSPKPYHYNHIKWQVQQLLQTFDLVNINISALGLPLQCFGLRGYEDYLAVTILASQHVERSLFTKRVPQLL